MKTNIFNLLSKDKNLQFLLNEHITQEVDNVGSELIYDYLKDTYEKELDWFDEKYELDADEIIEDLIIIWRAFQLKHKIKQSNELIRIRILSVDEDIEAVDRLRSLCDHILNGFGYHIDYLEAFGEQDYGLKVISITLDKQLIEEGLEQIGHNGYIRRFVQDLKYSQILFTYVDDDDEEEEFLAVPAALYDGMYEMLDEFLRNNGLFFMRSTINDGVLFVITEKQIESVAELLSGSKV